MEELIGLATSIAMVVLGLAFVWRQWLARSEARRARPIRARVLSVERKERGSGAFRWFVETRYDAPGHGELVHRRSFEEEGQALLWQRLHREGSEHDVVPNPREPGNAFMPAELNVLDWQLVAVLGMTSALAAWTGWLIMSEWVFE